MTEGQWLGLALIALGLLGRQWTAQADLAPQASAAGAPPPVEEEGQEAEELTGEELEAFRRRRCDRGGFEKYSARGAKLLIGMTGSGKSYYLEHTLLPELLKDGRDLVLIHDPWEDFTVGQRWPSIAAFKAAEGWPAINVFSSEEVTPRDLALLARELGEVWAYRVVLVIDELTDVVSPHAFLDGVKPVPGERRALTPLEHVIRKGRHYGVELLGTVQRPADLPASLRSQTWYAWIFALCEPRDLVWIEQAFGVAARQQVERIDPAAFRHVFFDRANVLSARARALPPSAGDA